MTKYVAFLRSINVGGRTVKMDRLRRLFESLGFSNVETFIASGNVMFVSASRNVKTLEGKIEAKLEQTLGYEVATFVRKTDELVDVAEYKPFGNLKSGEGLYIVFVPKPLRAATKRKLMAYTTKTDDFRVHKREIYWRCRTKFRESKFSGSLLEKILGAKATVRNVNTVRKIAEKCTSDKTLRQAYPGAA